MWGRSSQFEGAEGNNISKPRLVFERIQANMGGGLSVFRKKNTAAADGSEPASAKEEKPTEESRQSQPSREEEKEEMVQSLSNPVTPRVTEQPIVVFVLGGPGAGKGTQCAKIVEHFGFEHLSAGDLLRAEIKSGSENGEMIANMIKEGRIVPSEVTVDLLDKAMTKSGRSRFLIDGFPRDERNNQNWEDATHLAFVLFFEVPESVLEERLLKRGESSGRSDDNIESIKKRFHTYKESSLPIIQYYDAKGKAVKINGDRPVEEVWAEVQEQFAKSNIPPTPRNNQ
ncbi:hypothetical protein PROFUN_13646 [Planoprotostelium fungivorum]|uniref:UMP-CMP kinase n=1 Tax=Planoprotostelium fungivorum TaxID=1890364 RepID=A0A2P6N3D4_9EUKA|nr:hypothetical protein PROFUN_13646 [Planoprotostelium fungivorum]